ncbi:MAG: phytoene/squalene synthase family protein [bacterium]
MMDLYDKTSHDINKIITLNYSTSFSLGVKLLPKEYRQAIFSIYGFVRLADEIVDTFHQHDKEKLLTTFRHDTYESIKEGISTNPVLNGFQLVVNKYKIDLELIDKFLASMEMDLKNTQHTKDSFQKYVYGSAEAVGLMCLKVFYPNEKSQYESLKYYARKLGEAFQKVNFIRDIADDYEDKGRTYFPSIDFTSLTLSQKNEIELEIEQNFSEAYHGILLLKKDIRLAVFLIYKYYMKLFKKIKKNKPEVLMKKRVRINNFFKIIILFEVYLRNLFLKSPGKLISLNQKQKVMSSY